MRCKILIFHFIIFLVVNYTASAQGLSYTGLLSAGGGKYDSGSYSGFGVIGGSFSNRLTKTDSYRNYQGFLRNTEMNTGIDILSASKHNIIIFPNPVTDIFFIDYENTGIDKVLIVNFAGITVLEFRNGSQINISQLPEGLYLVKIFDNNNICLATRKIVKQ